MLAALAVASAFAAQFVPPQGWEADPVVRDLAVQRGAAIGVATEARAWSSPDHTCELFVTQMRVATDAEPAVYLPPEVDALIAEAGPERIVSRTQREDHGQAIADVVMVMKTGARSHARLVVAHGAEGLDVVIGGCIGDGAMYESCETRLSGVVLPIDPAAVGVDHTPIWRFVFRALGFLAVFGGAWLAIRNRARRRALRYPGSLQDHEEMTLTGVVQAMDAPLEAPLSGRACVVHRSRARVFTDDAIPRLTDSPTETVGARFLLATGSGSVIVECEALELELAPAAIVDHSEARELAFLARHGIPAERRERTSFDEIVIAPGARLAVRGLVSVGRDVASVGERGYRDDAPTVVRLVAAAGRPVVILRAW